jgi:MFS family permease
LANRAALACHMGGVSLLVLVIYGFMAWIPTFFARTYGMAAADAGLWFGIITAFCGAGGLVAGGWLADRGFRAGAADAHLRVIRLCVLGTAVLFVALTLAPSAATAFAILVPAMLAATLHGGVAGAALQLIAPSALRAQITAFYFFVANLIGLGLGPTAIALITDFVFRDDSALRYSMAIIAGAALPVSAVLLSLGLAPFRRAVAAAQDA